MNSAVAEVPVKDVVARLVARARAESPAPEILWVLLASAVIVLIASPVAMRMYRKER